MASEVCASPPHRTRGRILHSRPFVCRNASPKHEVVVIRLFLEHYDLVTRRGERAEEGYLNAVLSVGFEFEHGG